jgi:hypothetical protein
VKVVVSLQEPVTSELQRSPTVVGAGRMLCLNHSVMRLVGGAAE